MDYYKKLVELGCFSRNEIIAICNSETAANSLIYNYQKKHYIQQVRRDLYVAISFETLQPVANRFQIASKIAEDAVVSHHSAFEFYGCANQVFREVYVTTDSHFRDFAYDGYFYRRIAPKGTRGFNSINHAHITSLEKTIIDSISDFNKIAGLEETLRCIMLAPSINENLLLQELASYKSGFMYQKAGYFLEQLNDELILSQNFFDVCQQHISQAIKYLLPREGRTIFHDKWNLYAPQNILSVIEKGVEYNAAV